MKRILITGGAGFIGSNLALELIRKNYEVVVLDNLSKQIHGADPENSSPLYRLMSDKVYFVKGDVTNEDDWKKVLKGVDTVVHLAAETGTGQSMYEIQKYVDVNIKGTAILLNIITNYPDFRPKKVVIASSRAIYGEGKYYSKEFGVVYPDHRKEKNMKNGDFNVMFPESSNLTLMATDEESKIHPSSVYGITKQNQEQMILCTCNSIGVSSTALRYQNVYGPGQSLHNPYTGILSIFSNLILGNKRLNIFEDGLESRDFVFIDDVVDATILAIEERKDHGTIYNVGAGITTSVLDVATSLVKFYKKEVPIEVTGNFRLGDIRHNYADLKKIKKELGYTPQVKFGEGIQKFANWAQTLNVVDNRFENSLAQMKKRGLFVDGE